jgi:hypothetical protein
MKRNQEHHPYKEYKMIQDPRCFYKEMLLTQHLKWLKKI